MGSNNKSRAEEYLKREYTEEQGAEQMGLFEKSVRLKFKEDPEGTIESIIAFVNMLQTIVQNLGEKADFYQEAASILSASMIDNGSDGDLAIYAKKTTYDTLEAIDLSIEISRDKKTLRVALDQYERSDVPGIIKLREDATSETIKINSWLATLAEQLGGVLDVSKKDLN